MSVGIKETKEILVGMGEASVSGKKIVALVKEALKNGFGPEDLLLIGQLVDAAPDTKILEAAAKDADKALEEMKDLDKDEILQIIGEIYAQADRFNKA